MTIQMDTQPVALHVSGHPFYRKDATDLYFRSVATDVGTHDCAFVVVAHLLPTLPPFLEALEQVGAVVALVPKPRSIDPRILEWARARYAVAPWSRAEIRTPGFVDTELAPVVGAQQFAILDIGGYFAPVGPQLTQRFGARFRGVVEDTENGHRRYLATTSKALRCVSVARSLAKRNEDRWVGQSIVYSAESLLRCNGATLNLQRPLVIGYGKIGQSIAHTLRGRGLAVTVSDVDANQRVLARCDNFPVSGTRAALAGTDLVFCATGNRALAGADFAALRPGTLVVSVTSADDEFDFTALGDYARHRVSANLVRLQRGSHYFFLANDGNALNFVHGAEMRPFVHLTQAALLFGIAELLLGERNTGTVAGLRTWQESRISELFEQSFFAEVP